MRRRSVALGAVALTLAASATDADLPFDPYGDIAFVAVALLALLALGWYGGWSSLWIFSVVLVVVTGLYERLLWHDDPTLGGMDDMGPTGLVFGLPLCWALLVVGAAAREAAELRRTRPRTTSP